MDYSLEELSYPIGRFSIPEEHTGAHINKWINKLEAAPKWYDYTIENLDEAQLNTVYRPGGWTMNQVIHHVADSHMNGYTRLKLALTEDTPIIKPYLEHLWAALPEVSQVPVNVSITLLHSLHRRWAAAWRNMKESDFDRTYFHPEQQRAIPLWESLANYAWHGQHHFEQLNRLRERMQW